jgi:TonB family protein
VRRNRRFWASVLLVALAHAAGLIALLRWTSGPAVVNAQEITWLGGGLPEEAATTADGSALSASAATHEPISSQEQPATESDIQIPTSSPIPASTPRITPEPKMSPTATPHKTASPKRPPLAQKNKTPKQESKKITSKSPVRNTAAATATAKKSAATSSGGQGTSSAKGNGSSSERGANASWYGNMLHDRFYRAWDQPQTVVASGAKLSAVAKIRIEKDGRVSDFKIIRPSGNVMVDESIAAVGRKVTQVDAIPKEIGTGSHYDVNINFQLNADK